MAAYVVAAILALVMVTATLPPIIADESDRAVVNAPVVLITAPIAGTIEPLSISESQQVTQGSRVARIANSRVDRTTLIGLEGKVAAQRENIEAVRRKRASDAEYLASLDAEIARQRDQLIEQFEVQLRELRARVEEAAATVREKKTIVDRQTILVSRGSASSEMLKPTVQQYQAAAQNAQAETAKLEQKVAQLDALKQGVYTGEELATIAGLVQKRRDIDLDAQRLAIEEKELQSGLANNEPLVQAERKRLESLAGAEVTSPITGEVLKLDAAPGRYVAAGDSLASLVDCDKSFVVAIFSYRQGQNLKVGSSVRVDGARFSQGIITAVLPKTSDKVDERFAVPFPQTERRELYVIVEPDRNSDESLQGGEPAQGFSTACNVGQWVTVTRNGGWIPSVSGIWRKVRNAMLGGPSRPAQRSVAADAGRS